MQKPLFRSAAFRLFCAGVGAIALALVALAWFFPWDSMRGPVSRYVSGQLGRRFEITQHLAVHLGTTTTVRVEGIEIDNPQWAAERYLLKARSAEFDIKLWPLFQGKLELPRLVLNAPQIGLQIEPDGRRTWALSRDMSGRQGIPNIGALEVDDGSVTYRAVGQGADMKGFFSILREVDVAIAPAAVAPPAPATLSRNAANLPLSYKLTGKWKNQAFSANGRTGGVLKLSRDFTEVFPLEVNAISGNTTLKAKGTVENLQELSGLDARFDVQGRNLDELYKLLGVVLPSTPPYRLRGQLHKRDKAWSASQIQGVLGSSDLSGDLTFDTSGATPLLTGNVQSKLLDFADLRPVIGLPARALKVSGRPADGKAMASNRALLASKQPPLGKVLPVATLDLVRLNAMNADVTYTALDIRHVDQLPLDKGKAHIVLRGGVLQLDPVALGVAGGTLAGKITVDGNVVPAAFDTRLDVRALQLNQLFPTVQSTKSSFGKISGQVNLKGRGNSMAQMLGSSSGDVAVLMGKGEISNILLEFIGLDGGEIIKFFLRGDRNVQLLCAAAAFDVKQGVMSSTTLLLDTSDTVIHGDGKVSLADETLDVTLNPEPKDRSILSLRSPLRIAGTFAAPTAGPDKPALAARAGIALALGVINPFLALAATIETGPGKDADCTGALAIAAHPKSKSTVQSGPAVTAKGAEPVKPGQSHN